MSRVRSAASLRSNATGNSVRSGRTNRTAGTKGTRNTSSTVFEYPCNPCMREKVNVEATNYCQECGENLCTECVKQHLKFPSMKGHKILGKSERRATDETTPKNHPLECSEHPGKKVDMFCADHDEVWCGACIAVRHRTCHNVMLIQFAAQGITKRDEFKEAKENIRKIKKSIVHLKKKTEKDSARLEKQKATMMNKIKESRKRIDKILDDMEKTTISELERACLRGTSQMQEETKLYNDLISTLDMIGGMLTASKNDAEGEAGIFIGTKRATEKVKEGERILSYVKHTMCSEPIKFVPDGRIAGWLKSLKILGTFSHQQQVYTGSYLERHDVSIADEFRDCDMFGSSFLSDGRLLLTDWDNKKVKILDQDFKVIDQIVLHGHPDDVCSTNPHEAAVTMTMQKYIQFIKLTPKMYLSRIIYTEEHCRGITYHDGLLYVVCGGFKNEGDGKIVVYTIAGEHIRTVEKNNTGQRIFTCPIAVAVVSDGKLIHVTDGQRGIVTLTANNDVVSVISNKDFSWPCGMCLDKNDNVFICNGKSSNVIQLSGLDKISLILTKKEGIKRPHSICFDPNNLRIIMTSNKSKFISIYQLSSSSVKQVAEGANVKLEIAERDPHANFKSSKENANKPTSVNKGTENDTKINMAGLSVARELTKSERLDKSTNVVTVRSSQSKERTSDVSDQESTVSTLGRGKSNFNRSNLVGSRDKSTSRESVATSVKSDMTSQLPRVGGNRINSARKSARKMSGRLGRRDSTLKNLELK